MSEVTHAYIGIYRGVVRAAVSDRGDEDTALCVADIIRNGGIVERVTVETARTALFEPWLTRPAGDGDALGREGI